MGAHSSRQRVSHVTQPTLNVDNFMGVWYEIAHSENQLQANCADIMVIYTRNPATSQICVSYECIAAGGETSVLRGELQIPDLNQPSKLELTLYTRRGPSRSEFWLYES